MKLFRIKILLVSFLCCFTTQLWANYLVIPMDETQKNHLKSYGIAYKALSMEYEVDWLLNYQGGSFALSYTKEIENICRLKGVSYYIITPSQYANILDEKAHLFAK